MNDLTRLLILLIGFNVVTIDVTSGQCLDDDIIMFPPKSTDLFTGFGRDVVLQDNYLITSSNDSDSLAYESGVIFIYEWIGDQWEKVADLTPSEPVKWLQMGDYLRASENIIVARAHTYTEDSYQYEVIYVFKKEPGEKWTSRTESYILNPVPDIHEEYNGQVALTFDIKCDTLWVYHQYFYYDLEYKSIFEAENRLFKLGDGSAILFASLAATPSEDGTYAFHPSEVNLKFGNGFMVAGLERYQFSGAYGSGKVMVYYYDTVGGWEDPPIELTTSSDLQFGFGRSIAIHEDYVFIANMNGEVFIYKKQADDWSSIDEMAILSITTDLEGYFYDQIVANDKYVIHSATSEQKINVFVKDGAEWTSKSESDFQIDFASENRGYGWEMAISENHFVYNAFDFASDQAVSGSEIYSVTIDNNFESSGAIYDQVLYQHSYTSAGDEFSRSSSFYKSLGVVGTNLDNDKGYASGALNLYERNTSDLTWTWTSKLYSPDIQAYQNFGVAVAITDNYLFASSPFYDSLNLLTGDEIIYDIGKVYQFERVNNTWEFVQEILSPDLHLASSGVIKSDVPQLNNELSQSFSTGFNDFRTPQLDNGDLPRMENLFSYRNNRSEEILSTGDYNTYRQFGKSMAYHNGYLAIGQRFQGGSEYKGRIYIFKEVNRKWTHVATLRTSDGYYRDIIGEFPFVMNDTLIIAGSPNYTKTAFIFKRKFGEEWESGTEDAVLLPDRSVLTGSYPAEEFDLFGISVDMYNNTIVVGAPLGETDNRLGPNSGRVYVYEMPLGGWNGKVSYKHILKPVERILDGNFGYSVSIDQNNVFVGAPHSIYRIRYGETIYTDGDEKRGRVYVFDRSLFDEDHTVMNEVGQILPTGGHSYDFFGAMIEKNFLEIVISAPFADTENGDRSGAAYVFKKVGAIEEDIDPLCNESGIFDLVAYPVTGGIWSGEGVVDTNLGLFDPAGLPESTYTVSYQYGECTTSTNIAVYTKPVIIDRSDPINYLCFGSTVELFAESNKDYHEYRWFYRKSLSDTYSSEFQWNNRKSIDVTDEGYYYCISMNPACTSEPVFFEVVRVDEPTGLNQDGTIKYCLGETHTLSLQAMEQMDRYDWRYSSSTTSTNFNSINSNRDLQVTNSGLYFCYFEYLGCEFYSDTVNVQFDYERSDLSYSGNYELCVEEFISLGLAPANDPMTKYEWYWNTTGVGDYTFLSNDQQVTINQEGDYFCRSYSMSGCAYLSDTLEVQQQQVVLVFDPIESICDDWNPIALNVSPPGGRFTIMNTNEESFYDPTIDPKMFDNGSYEVKYEYEINHCMYQINQTFEIDIIDNEELFIPNAFTPNGDGVNDTFYFTRLGRQPSTFKFTVFNRAGSIVFKSNKYDFQWDGANQPSGVYYWNMSFGNKCEKRSLKGYVQLIR